jgi:AcrR family transcriptional regulator
MGLLREQGLGKVSAASITRAAGVSSGLFYWYFDDVDHLVRDALAEGVAAIRSAMAAELVGVDDPLERVDRRLRLGLRLIEEDDYVRFLLQADASGWMMRPDFAAIVAGGNDVLLDIVRDIAEGQARGHVRTDVPAFLLASCVRSVFADTLARDFRGEATVALHSAMDAVSAFVRQGIVSPERFARDEDDQHVSAV